ncbi:MAG: hypothetical protein HYY18_08340 [Planctomycetes bacterium]|nr:hypothetical protein [Planctomycetota bacterium]
MPITEHYRTESADTSPESEQVMIDLARRRTPGEKASRIWGMMEFVHDLAFAGLRRRRPELTDDQIRLRLTARRLGRELTMAACDWDPDSDER